MRSRMTGDFSRLLDEARSRDSALWMQQGRVQLDSDWNAQAEIANRRLATATADLVGESGAPYPVAGFDLSIVWALAFDGRDDYAYVSSPPAPGGAGFTWTAWIRPRPGGGALLGRFAAANGERDAALLFLTPDLKLSFRRAGSQTFELPPSAPLAPDRPHHVAVTCDGHSTAIYADGRLASTPLPAGRPLAPLPAVLLLGASLEDKKPRLPYAGDLGDVVWWDRALAPEEIARAAAGQHPADAPLARWPLAEGDGDAVSDAAAGACHGVLGSGVSRPAWTLHNLAIGPGRYYVDGALCVNPRRVLYTQQPEAPGLELPSSGVHLAVLDVWERFVTAIEDPSIAEVALGGPTTTTRSQTIPQVRLVPVTGEGREAAERTWKAVRHQVRAPRGRLAAQRVLPSPTPLGNLLYRVEIHQGGGAWGRRLEDGAELLSTGPPVAAGGSTSAVTIPVRVARDDGSEGGAADLAAALAAFAPGSAVELWPASSDAPAKGGVGAVRAVDPAAGTITLDALPSSAAGTASLALRRLATFKWSRNNGAVTYPIVSLAGAQATLASPESSRLVLPQGTVVEWIDDLTELAGRPGALYKVTAVDPDLMTATLSPQPDQAVVPDRHPFLRVWDQKADSTIGGAVVAQADWVYLEAGIQVRFAGDHPSRSGDYWWLPARTSTEDIIWPRDAAGAPENLPPAGPDRSVALLAEVSFDPPRVEDRRFLFQPVSTGKVSKEGDVMYGPLEIRSHLDVQGDIRAPLYFGRLGSRDVVGTDQIADGAVTACKLAFDVGSVPPGYSILGDTPEPPPGYVWSGSRLAFGNQDPLWRSLSALPRSHPGAIAALTAGNRVFALLETGELWQVDPATGDAVLYSRLAEPRRAFAAAVLDGLIYVAGGFDAAGHALGTVEVFDPNAATWTRRAGLPTARGGLALAPLGAQLHALGGRAGERPLATHEAYDPLLDRWTSRAPLPIARWGLAATAVGGGLHAAAGERRIFWFGRMLSRRHDEYRAEGDVWRRRARLLYGRRHPALVTIEGRLFLVGGEGALGPSNAVQRFEPHLGWLEGPPLPLPAAAPGGTAIGGTLLCVGGRSTDPAIPIASLDVSSIFYVHRKLEVPATPLPGPGS